MDTPTGEQKAAENEEIVHPMLRNSNENTDITPNRQVSVVNCDETDATAARAVRMRQTDHNVSGIVAWWRQYRGKRRSSAKRYSALVKRRQFRCQVWSLLAFMFMLLIAMAIMGYFLYRFHQQKIRLEKEVVLLSQEKDCFKREVGCQEVSMI